MTTEVGSAERNYAEWHGGQLDPVRLRLAWQRLAGPGELSLSRLPDGRSQLRLTVEGAAADAWSFLNVILPELRLGYADPDRPLDPAGPVHAGRARPRSAAEHAAAREEARRYWLDRLGAMRPGPALPAQANSAGRSGFQAQRTAWVGQLAGADWSHLTGMAERHGVTASGLLLAVWCEVLRTWSSTDEFTVGLIERSPRAGPARVVGALAGLSPVTVTGASCDRGFCEHALAIAHQIARNRDHPELAWPELVDELAGRWPAGVPAVFPVVLVDLLRTPCAGTGPDPLGSITRLDLAAQATVELLAMERDGALHYQLNVPCCYLAASVPEDLVSAFGRLLRILGTGPRAWRDTGFTLVPQAQLAVRARVNETRTDWPAGLLHTLSSENAPNRPDAPAVITSSRCLTYGDFARRVNQVGRELRRLGVRPNQLVAVVMRRGWEQVVAAHGVLAAGGAYLPVDSSVPGARLKQVLDDGDVAIVLTQSGLDGSVPWPSGVIRLCVDRDFGHVDDAPLDSVQKPTDLAYVIYTSGSTGVPKGVMVDHRGALNTIRDVNRRFSIGPRDRCLALSAMHFDLSVYDLFGMIGAGGAIVIPDRADRPDPAHWAELIHRYGVTFWNSVPSLLEMLVLNLEATAGKKLAASLRLIILAGDWIPVTLPDRMRALNPHVEIIGSGGPVETCVWSVIYPIGAVDPQWSSIPYGRPMANQRYHVLDRRLRPRPVWVPGEIYVSSDVGLALGYWRNESLTSQRFVILPDTCERAYATGDIGRYLPDGNIEILGRMDFQIKIQGIRIEPAEIEAAINSYPGVRASVVVGCGDPRDLSALHAFVVWAGGPRRPVANRHEGLRDFLADRLPASMVPTAFTTLDRLPLTGNGKVDRLALAHRLRPAAAH